MSAHANREVVAARRIAAAGRRAIAILALGLLAGCGPNYLGVETDSGHDPDARINRVQWAEFSHSVAFMPGRSTLTPAATRAIDAFLERERVGPPDRVIVVSRPDLADAARDQLAASREGAISEYLRGRRLAPQRESVGTAAPTDAVLLVVKRPLVATPACPDWQRLARGDEVVWDAPSYGCMTTTALGAMVADPNDLVEGRELTPADGGYLSKSVRRYREGKAKQAKTQSTK